jgi:hypothetical protein
MVYVTFGGIVVAVITIAILNQTLKATKEAADAAKESAKIAVKQLEISQRPWIGIYDAVVSTPLVISPDKSHVSVRFELKNAGTSIANGIFIGGSTTFGNFHGAAKNEEWWCKILPTREGLAHLMLPGENKPWTQGFTDDSPKIDLDENGLTQMWLSGCVFYFDQLKTAHRTPFKYLLVTEEGKGAFKPVGTIKGTLKAFLTGRAAD